MGRRKIQIKKIENSKARQVCFSKRRQGLFKKAHEYSRIAGEDVLIIAFSPAGRPFVCSSAGHPSRSSPDFILRNYLRNSHFHVDRQATDANKMGSSDCSTNPSVQDMEGLRNPNFDVREFCGSQEEEIGVIESSNFDVREMWGSQGFESNHQQQWSSEDSNMMGSSDCNTISSVQDMDGLRSPNFDVGEMWGSECFEVNQQQQWSSEDTNKIGSSDCSINPTVQDMDGLQSLNFDVREFCSSQEQQQRIGNQEEIGVDQRL